MAMLAAPEHRRTRVKTWCTAHSLALPRHLTGVSNLQPPGTEETTMLRTFEAPFSTCQTACSGTKPTASGRSWFPSFWAWRAFRAVQRHGKRALYRARQNARFGVPPRPSTECQTGNLWLTRLVGMSRRRVEQSGEEARKPPSRAAPASPHFEPHSFVEDNLIVHARKPGKSPPFHGRL